MVAFCRGMALTGGMATRHPPDYRTLASLSRINLLAALQKNRSQTIAQLSEATGLHHNTAREHLHRLIESGFVDSEPIPSSGKGRPRMRYRAAQGLNSPASQLRREASERRTEMVHKLLPISVVSGRSAPLSRQLDALDDHMEQCGFDSEVTANAESGQYRMVTHDCPFSALAKDHPQVCEVHFALIQDALDDGEGPIHACEIRPFSGPQTCTVDFQH